MDEFYAKRIQDEIERIANCTDAAMLGVDDDAEDEQIIHAYEAHLKNLGTNRCGYSPETRALARHLFNQLRDAAARLGVEVQHIDEMLGAVTIPPPMPPEVGAATEAAGNELAAVSAFPVVVGESGEHPIPNPSVPPFMGNPSFFPGSYIPTPASPVAPLMSVGSGPNPSASMHRVGSPPFPVAMPRAVTPAPMQSFPPGVPLSPGISPMNGSYASMPGGQAWPALGSVPSHPAFDAVQRRAENAEFQLSVLRKEHEQLTSESAHLRSRLKAAETIVEDLSKRLRAAQKLALMLRNAHTESKAKLEDDESDK